MKIDRAALAGMLAVSATVLAGCDEKVCVDKQGKRVPEQYCGGHGGSGVGGAIAGYYLVSGWRGGGVGTVDGVARGGFGGEAAGHAGGSGGE